MMSGNSRERILKRINLATQLLKGSPLDKSIKTDGPIRRGQIASTGDLVDEFQYNCKLTGAAVHMAGNGRNAKEIISQIIRKSETDKIVIWEESIPHEVEMGTCLHGVKSVCISDTYGRTQNRGGFFDVISGVQVGITGVDFAIADTGSIVLMTYPGRARSISLLPPIHIAIMKSDVILPTLHELSLRLDEDNQYNNYITIITGPSKTADIEFNLVHGIHGPGELHVIVLP